MTTTGQVLSRRDRVRAATISEIKQTARRLLVAEGPNAVTLRAIAREMGMTAPALYRYFGSHEDLIAHVLADIFTEIASDVQAAIEQARQVTGDSMPHALVAACREFRSWALAHRGEFGLVFGSPLPSVEAVFDHEDVLTACAQRFGGTFLALFVELWNRAPFPVPADAEIEPALRDQLARHRADLGVDMPLGAVLTYLRSWVRLYGAVSLEVFGHLRHALADAGPMFDYTLAELASLVCLEYPPPDPGTAAGTSGANPGKITTDEPQPPRAGPA